MRQNEEFNKKVRTQFRELRQTIGKNIHAARCNRGLTLEKLAKLIAIPADRIDRVEIGKDEPRLYDVIRLSVALDWDTQSVFQISEFLE